MKVPFKYLIITAILIFSFENYSTATNNINTSIKIILRIDDYGLDNSSFYKDLIRVINKNNCSLTISVVPFNYENSRLVQIPDSLLNQLNLFCKSNPQIEIALHGFAHQNNFKITGSGEFALQPFAEQFSKIKVGKNLLETKLGSQIVTFVPPWNSFDAATTIAAKKAGIKLISASTYSQSGGGAIDAKISYLPYTITLTHLMTDASMFERIGKLSANKIVVILFHATDFIENQDYYVKKQNSYLLTGKKTNLAEFDTFLRELKKNPTVKFLNFRQIMDDPNEDLSCIRYQNARLHLYTTYYWPTISPEELVYLERAKANWKRYLFIYYPIIFYFIICSLGFILSAFLVKALSAKPQTIILKISLGIILLLSGLLFLKISLKIFISIAFFLGIILGFLILRSRNTRIHA
jgi:hypothetical protein